MTFEILFSSPAFFTVSERTNDRANMDVVLYTSWSTTHRAFRVPAPGDHSRFSSKSGDLRIWKSKAGDGAVRSGAVDVCTGHNPALCDSGWRVAVSQTQNRTNSCGTQRYTYTVLMSLCLATSLSNSKLVSSLGSSSSCGLPDSHHCYPTCSGAKFIAEELHMGL